MGSASTMSCRRWRAVSSQGSGCDSLLGVAHSARLPVFSNMAGHARRGGLFDLGASYYEVGQEVGRIASDILSGADPAAIPVRDYVPRRILLNERTRQALRGHWQFDEAVQAQAAEIILDGMLSGKARVLVGPDAKVLDALVRLTGSGYQRLVAKTTGRALKRV